MKNKLKIGNETFNECGIIFTKKRGIYHTLFDAYDKPSKAKQQIWAKWLEYFYTTDNFKDVLYVDIMSRNSMRFTIIAGAVGKDNKIYIIKIYPTHNDIFEYVV